jgi:hypothetical protein
MHDHRSHADSFHKDHIEQDMSHRFDIVHQAPTQLDDCSFVSKPTYPTHRFDEGIGFGNRFFHGVDFS